MKAATRSVNDALYEQLQDTSRALDQPIRGLEGHIEVSSSPQLQEQQQAALTTYRYQKSQIERALECLDECDAILGELINTGWPDQPTVHLTPELYQEMQGENDDLDAGAAVFIQTEPPATHFAVTEGEQQPPAETTELPRTGLDDGPPLYNPRRRR